MILGMGMMQRSQHRRSPAVHRNRSSLILMGLFKTRLHRTGSGPGQHVTFLNRLTQENTSFPAPTQKEIAEGSRRPCRTTYPRCLCTRVHWSRWSRRFAISRVWHVRIAAVTFTVYVGQNNSWRRRQAQSGWPARRRNQHFKPLCTRASLRATKPGCGSTQSTCSSHDPHCRRTKNDEPGFAFWPASSFACA